jgi:hypothetical protein
MTALPETSAGPQAPHLHWLRRGLTQPGGKLPLFDEEGQRVDKAIIKDCLTAGWAERWFKNPLKPDWVVCRLTDAGRAVLSDRHSE